ncbi:MAG TPA: CAP domain-containing protein [Micromonospora sp.]|nr:CAP domain-containing protein [Micromonospora sp.]
MQRTSRRVGRHRAARPSRRPLGWVVAGAVLLVVFGVAAALLPPNFGGTPDPAPVDGLPSQPAAPERPVSVIGSAPPPTMAAPTSPSARPSASPPRTSAPRPRPSPTRTSSTASTGGTEAQQVLALVNKERAANDCGAVTINDRLTTAAQRHSQDQADHNTMSHTGSDGSTPWQRAERAGYSHAIGENVAAGYRTPAAVMNGWMNSPGHRANILNCRARAMGLGVVTARNGTHYWTQMFGSVP